MKSGQLVAIVIVIVVTAALVNFLRVGADWPMPRVLPGCDGLPLSPMHFLAGAVLILLMLWGLRRLGRSAQEEDSGRADSDYLNDSYGCVSDPENGEGDENQEA